jgi:hypothetical protein
MSYYMGDFYRGDPGIGSFLSGLVKGIPVVGNIIESVASPIAKVIGRSSTSAFSRLVPAAAITAAAKARQLGAAGVHAVARHPVLSAAGAAGALAAGGAELMSTRGTQAGAGMNMRAGGRGMLGLRKRRRMNVANGRALSRATRRLHAFARRYRKVVGFVSPHKPKGRMYFKKRKRAA